MELPRGFQFSQASLQDYVECRRRFHLRHVMHLAWPAVEAEPVLENERFMRQGGLFHRMVHQSLLGIPAERLSAMIQDQDLEQWWANFVERSPLSPSISPGSPAVDVARLTEIRFPEINLSAPLASFRLVAKCDLVVSLEDGKCVIFDWKTSRKRPKRDNLMKRMQTRVYPFLFVEAGNDLTKGAPIQPEQVEMIYWFANFPDHPERFPYSQKQFEADRAYLTELVAEIASLDEGAFLPALDDRRCRFCVYRSLCDRGVTAGHLDEADDLLGSDGRPQEEFSLELDFDQIGEIEF